MADDRDRRNLAFDSFDAWHQLTCRELAMTQCTSEFEAGFEARWTGKDYGAFYLGNSLVRARGHILRERHAADIRRDQIDDVMIMMLAEGEVGFSQNGRSMRLSQGTFLYDQARPFKLAARSRLRVGILGVPRSSLTSLLPDMHDLTGALRLNTSFGILATSMLQQLFSFGRDGAAELVSRLGSSTLDVLALALDPGTAEQIVGERSSRFLVRDAKAYMEAHIAEAHDVATLSERYGIPPRTLNRLFASEGTTPIRWLWQRRLRLAHEALRCGRAATVAEAAKQHGFRHPAHFSRAFKEAFGYVPMSRKGKVGD